MGINELGKESTVGYCCLRRDGGHEVNCFILRDVDIGIFVCSYGDSHILLAYQKIVVLFYLYYLHIFVTIKITRS
jgi:hypothetical protein